MEALYMLCTFTVQITFALILMMPLYVPLKISQSHQHWRKRAKFTGAYSCGKLITTANKQTNNNKTTTTTRTTTKNINAFIDSGNTSVTANNFTAVHLQLFTSQFICGLWVKYDRKELCITSYKAQNWLHQ